MVAIYIHAGSLPYPWVPVFLFQPRGQELRHIHVQQAERYAKFWLKPLIELVESRGFRGPELQELHSLIENHREKFIVVWDEHFGQ